MQKSRLHNNRIITENVVKKTINNFKPLDRKIIVDINKLLNRVKVVKKNEAQKKIIFFSSLITCLVIMGTFIVVFE